MTTRANRIQITLDHHFHDDIEVSVSTPEPTWWWDNINTLGPWGVLGIGIPVNHPGTGELIVPYCPQIIEEQTRHCDDNELDQYLALLQLVLDLYITHHDIDDRNDRHDVVEREIASSSPQGLEAIAIQIEVLEFRHLIPEGL